MKALKVEVRAAIGYRSQGIVEARVFVREYNDAKDAILIAVTKVMEESQEIRNQLDRIGDVFGHHLVDLLFHEQTVRCFFQACNRPALFCMNRRI